MDNYATNTALWFGEIALPPNGDNFLEKLIFWTTYTVFLGPISSLNITLSDIKGEP